MSTLRCTRRGGAYDSGRSIRRSMSRRTRSGLSRLRLWRMIRSIARLTRADGLYRTIERRRMGLGQCRSLAGDEAAYGRGIAVGLLELREVSGLLEDMDPAVRHIGAEALDLGRTRHRIRAALDQDRRLVDL